MKDFINLPFRLYKNDANWVPPLRSEVRRTLDAKSNPYFRSRRLWLLICYKNKMAVSRIALIIKAPADNSSVDKCAQFGFFESINDVEAVHQLMIKVESICKEFDTGLIEGPFSPNHYSELGMQTSRFGTTQSFFQTYNPEYYNELLKSNGFAVSGFLHTRNNNLIKDFIKKNYNGNTKKINQPGYSIRQFNLKKLKRDLEFLREIYNDAFASNRYFSAVSREEYLFTAKYLKWIAEPELIRFVEYEGKPVGVVQCIRDINPLIKKLNGRMNLFKFLGFIKDRKNLNSLIIYAVGIKKSFQHSDVFNMLFNEMISIAKNFDVLETTWMYKENLLAVRAAERLGLTPDKEFVIYEKRLK